MDYALDLHENPRGATISNVGVEFHSPSMLFWVKAGVGFTAGAVLTYAVAWMLYVMLLANLALGLGRMFIR